MACLTRVRWVQQEEKAMILRYGFYEGRVAEAERGRFDAHFDQIMIPMLARMPGLAEVRLLRGLSIGSLSPRFHHAIELSFPDEASLVRAMQSEERRAIQAAPNEVLGCFAGGTPHANFRVVQSLRGPNAS